MSLDYVDIHITFYDAPNDLKSLTDLDIYVTVSNSKRLSKDNISEFHGKSDEIRVHPLSFSEFNKRGGILPKLYSTVSGSKNEAFDILIVSCFCDSAEFSKK